MDDTEHLLRSCFNKLSHNVFKKVKPTSRARARQGVLGIPLMTAVDIGGCYAALAGIDNDGEGDDALIPLSGSTRNELQRVPDDDLHHASAAPPAQPAASTSESVSYTHLTLPTICSV